MTDFLLRLLVVDAVAVAVDWLAQVPLDKPAALVQHMMGVDGFPQLQVMNIKDSHDPVVMQLTRTAEEAWKQPGHSGWQILTQPIVSVGCGVRWCRAWQHVVVAGSWVGCSTAGACGCPWRVCGSVGCVWLELRLWISGVCGSVGCVGQWVAFGWGLGGWTALRHRSCQCDELPL